MIRFAAVGTASTGKSALLNVLFGTRFPVDVRSRSTAAATTALITMNNVDLEIVDTPPLESTSARVNADAYLLVCDKDLIDVEYEEAVRISRARRPIGIALNKADTYRAAQVRLLLNTIRRRVRGVVSPERIAACAADPVRITFTENRYGEVVEHHSGLRPDVESLNAVVDSLIADAEVSLRVRAREMTVKGIELAGEASSRVAEWLKRT
jgi:GTPase SAR1 family protein